MPTISKKRKSGPHLKAALRWTLNNAAKEFGAHREKLERRRRALDIQPGNDDCFSSREVAAMLFGDRDAELTGKIAAERKGQELKNARTEGELVPTAAVMKLCERVVIVIRQKICTSSLTESEKDEILNDLVRLGETDWARECE